LRELKLEHQQGIDAHEAFRVNVEAKESARALEASSFDIKKQALVAEHQLALKQNEASQKSRLAQLEREIQRAKADLDDAREENERLTLALESGSGLPDDIKSRSNQEKAYLYEEEPKQTREERKAEFAELASTRPEVEPEESQPSEPTSTEQPTTTTQESAVTTESSGGDETAF